MAAAELSDYLKNGNIAHSVNLPDVSQPRVSGRRICMIHKNTRVRSRPSPRCADRGPSEH